MARDEEGDHRSMCNDDDIPVRMPRADIRDRRREPGVRLVRRLGSYDAPIWLREEAGNGRLQFIGIEPAEAGAVVLVQVRNDLDGRRKPRRDNLTCLGRLWFGAGGDDRRGVGGEMCRQRNAPFPPQIGKMPIARWHAWFERGHRVLDEYQRARHPVPLPPHCIRNTPLIDVVPQW